jgi:hypothetical protein
MGGASLRGQRSRTSRRRTRSRSVRSRTQRRRAVRREARSGGTGGRTHIATTTRSQVDSQVLEGSAHGLVNPSIKLLSLTLLLPHKLTASFEGLSS